MKVSTRLSVHGYLGIGVDNKRGLDSILKGDSLEQQQEVYIQQIWRSQYGRQSAGFATTFLIV